MAIKWLHRERLARHRMQKPCGFCRPTEVRNYDGATARRTEPLSEAERVRRYVKPWRAML